MDDDTLFPDLAHARNSDPETSHEAAASISAAHIRKSQIGVWVVLARYGPATDVDLCERYHRSGLPRQSDSGIRTRRDELRRRGMVEDTGRRAVLASGRRAIVWAAVKGQGP